MCSIIFYLHNEYTCGDIYVNNLFFSVTLQLQSADKSCFPESDSGKGWRMTDWMFSREQQGLLSEWKHKCTSLTLVCESKLPKNI